MKREIASWAFGLILVASPVIVSMVRAQKGGLALATIAVLLVATPGFGLLGRGLMDAYRATRAATWPTAPARVTSLELVEDDGGDGPTTYRVEVRYGFTVAGKAYEGSRLAFGYSSSRDATIHQQIHRQLAGAKAVAARYDPADPRLSCLSPGVNKSTMALIVFGVVWILGALGVWLLLFIEHWSDSRVAEGLLIE